MLPLLISGCKTLNTELTVRERKMPASFNVPSTDSVTWANTNWRSYFADEALTALIDTALNSNFDMLMALQRIEMSRAGVRGTTGDLFPQLQAEVSAGVDKFARYTPDFAGNSTTDYEPGKGVPNPLQNYFVGFTATWEVDIWGKLRNSRKAAMSNYLASVAGKNFVTSNLVAEVATAYYELIALDNALDIVLKTIAKREEALEAAEWQKEAGRADLLAVQQFRAQLLNARSLEIELSQQIIETENRVNFLLGRYPEPIVRNKENLYGEMPKAISAGVPSQLLLNRPDIRQAEYQVQASKFNLKAARAAFFPNINIGAALGFNAFYPKFLFSSPASIGYSVLGGLAAPLLNMSSLKAQFASAKAGQLTAMYEYRKSVLDGFMEVSNQLSNLDKLQQISTQKKEESEVLLQAIETSVELFRSARTGYLDLIVTQESALQAQLELVDVEKRRQSAKVNLYKALGGGWK
jgi:NodT family efflux transporter outer membrane factor (OMF) lipoprotein